ncbi:hypothetical protein BDA99DRAFT_596744 [Phascolomyces articulosus]|uniref:F-box domain-containing protein n=1 Tax=Phascolomyces articulosus TaxID=60185 RepID=A0AAD5K459_9FUNG|nr:hypothetical protein BDA99DRAFT_596744 [Phascolomyces articulosus]
MKLEDRDGYGVTNNTKNLNDENELMLGTVAISKDQHQRKKFQGEATAPPTKNISFEPGECLRAGRLYASHGYQKQALELLNKGLEQVPRTDTYYELLTQEKYQAQRRLEHRVDFFTCLPYDISCCIIDYVPQDTAIQCSRVSSAWRVLLLNYPKPWRYIYVPKNYSTHVFHISNILGIVFTTRELAGLMVLKELKEAKM